MTAPEFLKFASIPRLNRDVVVTEKIDGTNCVVYVSDDLKTVMAGNREKWLTTPNDSYGFAAWVEHHADELRGLGGGYHRGEWWGGGIGCGYGLGVNERRWSLFNVKRWGKLRPHCCGVVPVIIRGALAESVEYAMAKLREYGSIVAPNFMQPEGIVVYHAASNGLFKVTLRNDEKPRSRVTQ